MIFEKLYFILWSEEILKKSFITAMDNEIDIRYGF